MFFFKIIFSNYDIVLSFFSLIYYMNISVEKAHIEFKRTQVAN